jgi:tetratricopeptide (TPR) repeat protein
MGLLLWDFARHALLWLSARPDDRPALFGAAGGVCGAQLAMAAPAPGVPADALWALVAMQTRPEIASRPGVARACRALSAWAESSGALATATLHAEAAALCCPGNAELSYHAGRLTRRRANYVAAERWLYRAVLLGRQTGDHRASINARAGLGNLFVQRGNYPRAERYHQRALKLAHRHGYTDIQGAVLHALCGVAGETGKVAEMNAFARDAHVAYGPHHPRLPALANDVADVWMDQGLFDAALRVFQATWRLLLPADQIVGRANVCRAAAGTGERQTFEAAWSDVCALADRSPTTENLAQALLDIARGASLLGEWNRTERAATRSLELALTRGEARVRISAEAILDLARTRLRAPAELAETPAVLWAHVTAPAASPVLRDAAAHLSTELAASFAVRADGY